MHTATIEINPSSGAVSSISVNSQSDAVALSGVDSEGIAYDPATGDVYISDEEGPKIKSYTPGSATAKVTVPMGSLFSGLVGNRSLESLTISGDGLTMWTCNEEALTRDGAITSESAGTTVRLTKFVRANLAGSTWTCAGQWAYTTDKFMSKKILDRCCHGVSDLAVLPDGTLLVLERDCSGSDKYSAYLNKQLINISIYAIDPSEFSEAKNIKNVGGLKDTTFTPVVKTRLFGSKATGISNYEGMCLGPRLNDGSTSLLLISDGDTSSMEVDMPILGTQTITLDWARKIYALKLTGGEIVNLNSTVDNANATAYPQNGPYRYMAGDKVQVSCSVNDTGYENYVTVKGYRINNGALQNNASVTLNADTTIAWEIAVNSAMTGLLGDHFEQYAPGTLMNNLHGWTGEGEIKELAYSAPSAGYPLPKATHTKVLNIPGEPATRSYAFPGDTAGSEIDMMICPTWITRLPTIPDGDDMQVALCVAEDGAVMIYHASADGSANLWTKIPDIQLANKGDWARVTMKFNYRQQDASFVQVRVNGKLCVSSAAAINEMWFRTPSNARKVRELSITGVGSVDDVVATDDLSSRRSGVSLIIK